MHVVRNLIDNAVRYTLSGGISVRLSRSKDNLLLSVKDSGVGITQEDKARLFTEGGHGKDSLKVNVHSTGYGLYFAKGIVEATQGAYLGRIRGRGRVQGCDILRRVADISLISSVNLWKAFLIPTTRKEKVCITLTVLRRSQMGELNRWRNLFRFWKNIWASLLAAIRMCGTVFSRRLVLTKAAHSRKCR